MPSTLVATGDFTTADKTEINSGFYQNDDESVIAGVWECAFCKETFDAYPVDEMMTVISGSVTLTSPAETEQTFGKGDTFFMPKRHRLHLGDHRNPAQILYDQHVGQWRARLGLRLPHL